MPDTEQVMKRLAEVEDHLTRWLANQNKDAEEFRTKMYSALFGDVEDQEKKPGLFGRLARLEQRQLSDDKVAENKNAWKLATWAAIVGLAFVEFWNWLTKK